MMETTTVARRQSKTLSTTHISASTFQDWLATSKPGETLAYALGNLGFSVELGKNNTELIMLKEQTWLAYVSGRVNLCQRLVFLDERGLQKFEYLAQRTSSK